MIETIIQRLQADIEHAQQLNWPEQVKEASERLQTVNRLWSKFNSDPLVQSMEKVVTRIVEAYHLDFYELDLSRMEKIGEDTPFCWFVRNHGTDLFPLEGDEETIRNAEAWFDCVRQQFADGTQVKDTQRLYLCNPKTKTMKRLKDFSEVHFRAKSAAITG
ncbi:hypothetical protein P4H32_32450 [Bacillus cereus]|nr:hypothetical protein [Bacillus cereus]